MKFFSKRYLPGIIGIIGIFIIFYAQFFTDERVFDFKYAIYSDMWPNYIWHRLGDSSLFLNDSLANYFYNEATFNFMSREFFMAGLFFVLTKVFPLTLSLQIKGMFLCLVSTIMFFKIVKQWYGRSTEYSRAIFFLVYTLSMDTFYGGYERAWGFLVLLMLLLFISKKKYWLLPFSIPFSFFTYPSITLSVIVICFLTLILLNFDRDKNAYPFKKRLIYWCFFLSVFFLTSLYLVYNKSILTQHFLAFPQNYMQYKYTFDIGNGRWNSIEHIILHFIFNINEHSTLYGFFTWFFIVANAGLLLWLRKRAFSLPKSLYVVVQGSIIGFILVFSFHPALASRQMIFTMPLFMVLFFCINIGKIMRRKYHLEVLALVFSVIFIVLHPCYNDISSLSRYSSIFCYFEKLFPPALIAGHPESTVLRFIPLFSKKKVYPLSDKFLEELWLAKSFIELSPCAEGEEFIVAMYSNSRKDIRKYVDKYRITHWLVEQEYFSKDYFTSCKVSGLSFEEKIFETVNKNNYQGCFFLLELAKREGVPMGGKIFILDASKI